MAFHLAGALIVPLQDLPAVRAALPSHIRLTRAEPGYVAFEVEEQDGGVFAVRESFLDEAAFAAHQSRLQDTEWSRASANARREYRTWSD